MGCPECSRLSHLFTYALRDQAEIHTKDVGLVRDLELELSAAQIDGLKTKIVDHQAMHDGVG